MSVYIKNAANPFIPGGGSKEWRSNGLILNDESLRNKARMRSVDKQVTEGYMVYAEMTGDRSLQLGGGAAVMQLGSDPTRYDVWAEPRDDISGCETPHSRAVNPFKQPKTFNSQTGGVSQKQKNEKAKELRQARAAVKSKDSTLSSSQVTAIAEKNLRDAKAAAAKKK